MAKHVYQPNCTVAQEHTPEMHYAPISLQQRISDFQGQSFVHRFFLLQVIKDEIYHAAMRNALRFSANHQQCQLPIRLNLDVTLLLALGLEEPVHVMVLLG